MTRLSRIIQSIAPAEPAPAIGTNSVEAQTGQASTTTGIADPTASIIRPKHNRNATSERTLGEATPSMATGKGSTKVQPKSATILAMLRKRNGATLQQLMDATGWQAHSVRGFLSGHIRKKLGLSISGEVGKDRIRRYRVTG
jgi:hypothetical protein